MEELKILIEMVANLPQMALWVLIGFFAYKVIVIGSVFGIIRLAIVKLHDYLCNRKEIKEITANFDGLIISNCHNYLLAQLGRLVGKGVSIDTSYIHQQSVDWLREAIDDKIEKDIREKLERERKKEMMRCQAQN